MEAATSMVHPVIRNGSELLTTLRPGGYKATLELLAALALALAAVQATPVKRANPQGIDVSSYQPNINWPQVAANGVQFAYIKATEGTSYISPQFSAQYTGATNAHLIRGAYHFARPGESSGAAQANYFLAHGGGWSGDGITLPGAIDLEAGCSGLSQRAMAAWIKDFSNTYHARTGRYPVIYTTTSWWNQCTGGDGSFGSDNPLWLARWASAPGPLPAGWSFYSFWQYADKGPNPGDADLWNGSYENLQKFARGG
ncbi:glycoside hydrolase family 25 protein [Tylopilus felleus]